MNQFSRTSLLIGDDAIQALANSTVAIFGVGGVGGYVVEALARSGIGTFHLIDDDTVSLSNCNRQILATHDTIGRVKVEVAAERIHAINPNARVVCHKTFYLPETASEFDFTRYDYVVDAIDTVTGKIGLILQAQAAGTPIISSMGTGNKLDPSRLRVGDIYQTAICPLARIMRKELRKRGVKALKVVYSTEPPIEPLPAPPEESDGLHPQRRAIPGSSAYVPATAGLMIAAEIVRDLSFPLWPEAVRKRPTDMV